MKYFLRAYLAVFLALVAGPAAAQNAQYSPPVTRNHVACWIANGVLGDCGTAANGIISSLGITASGPSFCQNSAASSSGAWQQMCLGVTTTGGGTISLQNFGTAPTVGLSFIIDGITYPFPGSLSQITIGTTPVVGGNANNCLYVTAGNVVGQQTCAAGSIFALTGDVTATGPGTVPATLATVNPNVGTFGSLAVTPVVTVNGKGLITAISNVTIAIPGTQLTGTTLATNIVTSSLTTIGTIGTGVWQGTIVGATYGGTGINNGSNTLTLAASLSTTGAGAPTLAFPGTSFTYTFQGSSDTLVGRATTDTLTNKTLTTPTINGAALSGTFSGTPSLSGANFITNTNLIQSAAATLKGNPTASLANASDFTVQGLSDISSPNTTLDWIPIYNHTTGTVEKVNASELTSSVGSGVTSLNGLSGTVSVTNAGGISVNAGGSSVALNLDTTYTGLTADNCTLAASVSGNALTVALKTSAGSDPTSTTPCTVKFRSATAATGTITAVTVTGALSFSTGTSGSTFGSTNGNPFRLWITAFNNAGTIVLGVSNQSTPTQIFSLNTGVVQSSTACSACTNAASAGVYYTTAAQTSEAIEILGYLEWGSGLATAGTWASGPTLIQNFGPGVKKPGEVAQGPILASTSTAGTSTSATFVALTSGTTISITPTAAMNLIKVEMSGTVNNSASGSSDVQMSRGTTAATNLIGPVAGNNGAGVFSPATLWAYDFPGVATSTTYAMQGKTTSGTVSFPLNGLQAVFSLTEIMG